MYFFKPNNFRLSQRGILLQLVKNKIIFVWDTNSHNTDKNRIRPVTNNTIHTILYNYFRINSHEFTIFSYHRIRNWTKTEILQLALPLPDLWAWQRVSWSPCPSIGIIRHFTRNTFRSILWMKFRPYPQRPYTRHHPHHLVTKQTRQIEHYPPKLDEKRR